MSKFLKYVGKYDKLDYKNHVFIKGKVEQVDDNLADFIMSKGYLSTQFKEVAGPDSFVENRKSKKRVEVVSDEDSDTYVQTKREYTNTGR